jgi:hypothetical protein
MPAPWPRLCHYFHPSFARRNSLVMRCSCTARRSDRIYTFNLSDFVRLRTAAWEPDFAAVPGPMQA